MAHVEMVSPLGLLEYSLVPATDDAPASFDASPFLGLVNRALGDDRIVMVGKPSDQEGRRVVEVWAGGSFAYPEQAAGTAAAIRDLLAAERAKAGLDAAVINFSPHPTLPDYEAQEPSKYHPPYTIKRG